MKYYVIRFDENWTTFVSMFDSASLACNFIEKEMDRDTTYELSDFMIVHGQEFKLKEMVSRKIYLTNAS